MILRAASSGDTGNGNPDKGGTLDRKEAAKAGIKSNQTFDTANPDNDGMLDLAEYLAALAARASWLPDAAYGVFGLDGLAHYTLVLCSEHTLWANITVWSEGTTGPLPLCRPACCSPTARC